MKQRKDVVGSDVPTITIELAPDPAGGSGVLAVYFKLLENKVAKTIEADEPDVFVDVDAKGAVVGIELINPAVVNLKKVLKKLASRYKLDSLKQLQRTQAGTLKKLEEVLV